MTLSNIRVKPLTAAIGAEVEGVNLAEPLSDATFTALHDALMNHQVIFFRDQEMTLEQHKDLGRRFGKLHIHPASPGPEGHPEILVVHADAKSKHVAGEGWHTDVSCDVEPPMGSILHIHTAPEIGGDTLFSNMYAAYEALSDRMRDFLDGLTALHRSEHVHKGRYGQKETLRDDGYPEAIHPDVRTHPVTGRKALYVNRNFTTRIVGLRKNESDALLEMLWRHSETPEFQCRFAWRPNSIAFWDNRSAMHHAMWDYFPHRRMGHRVTVKGDRPFFRA